MSDHAAARAAFAAAIRGYYRDPGPIQAALGLTAMLAGLASVEPVPAEAAPFQL